MFLYRLEAVLKSGELLQAVVVEESDIGAFQRGESLIKRQHVTSIEIKEIAIVEKRTLQPGAGYVFTDSAM